MSKVDDAKTLVHKYIDDQFESMSDGDLQNLAGGGGDINVSQEGPSEASFKNWLSNNEALVKKLQERLGGK